MCADNASMVSLRRRSSRVGARSLIGWWTGMRWWEECPTMATFQISVSNLRLSQLPDLTPVHRAMAQRLKQIIQESFGSSGSNRIEPWKPLAESTAKRYKKLGYGNSDTPTLYRSGELYRSIGASWGRNAGYVFCASPIGEYHQFGTSRMPRRAFFPFGRDGRPSQYAQNKLFKVALTALS